MVDRAQRAQPAERGAFAWGWVVRVSSLGTFIFSAVVLPLMGRTPHFGVAFLAICGAVFPTQEFVVFLKSWRQRDAE